jgi:hypothetical protein
MSGVAAANSRRACKHILRYALEAVVVRILSLPCSLIAYCISRLASLHASVNHGARVFPHLLGFLGEEIWIFLTTPACTASYNKKFSTAAARSSLLLSRSYTRSLNFCTKFVDPVCSAHFYADSA